MRKLIPEKYAIVFLTIIYAVGIAGFCLPTLQKWVVPLTPINIAMAFLFVLLYQQGKNTKFFFVLLCIAVLGYFLEYLGVETGKIFGEYKYGKTLGPSWQGIPFAIGLNWASLVLLSCNIANRFIKHKIAATIAAAIGMVMIDYLIEPVAMKYDFWNWKGNEIPFQNYIAWFAAALVFCLYYTQTIKVKYNKLATAVLVLQIVFFATIHFYIQGK